MDGSNDRPRGGEPPGGTQVGLAPPPLERAMVQGGVPSIPPELRATWQDHDVPTTRDRVRLGPGIQVPGTKYRLIDWVGDGSMGIVYRAKHLELEREVALKILRSEASSPQLASLFRQEARNASRIGSHYIVEVYDLGELPDGRVWFTMPLLSGHSLRDLIATEQPSTGRVIGILRQICKGLSAAHSADIIHRDIKPENVMLVRDRGRDDAVRLLDWGVAAMRGEAEAGSVAAAGTPYYVAPEIISSKPYDERVDIYSLGCAAFEVLTGDPPYTGETISDLLVAHLEAPIPSARALAPERVPELLDQVIQRCMAKSPEDRYPSAEELEAALCEAQIAAKLSSTWDDLPLPDVEPDRRAKLAAGMPDVIPMARRRRLLPALAVTAALLVGGVGLWSALRDPTTAEDLDAIETLETQAQEAAARAYFVIPPADAPSTPTAYTSVLDLESIEGSGEERARRAAETLRGEFAATLVRLGDRYWQRKGGRPFALDYYAQALVFDPENERAIERASLTMGQLADLRRRAAEHGFTPGQLVAAGSLVALAEEDPQDVAQELARLAGQGELGPLTAHELDELIAGDPELAAAAASTPRGSGLGTPSSPSRTGSDRREAAAGDDAGTTGGADDEADPSETTGPEDGGEDEDAEDADDGAAPDAPPSRDKAAARAAVRRGDAALARGDLTSAERAYQQALEHDDRHAAAFDGLGRLEFHRGKYAMAARHGEKAVRMSPRTAKYRIDLGDAYYKSYRYSDAVEQYERAEALGHSGAAARLRKAKAKLSG